MVHVYDNKQLKWSSKHLNLILITSHEYRTQRNMTNFNLYSQQVIVK